MSCLPSSCVTWSFAADLAVRWTEVERKGPKRERTTYAFAGFLCGLYQYLGRTEVSFSSSCDFPECNLLVRFLNDEQQENLTRDVFNNFATHYSDLVRDVTDADCWVQNGSTHGRVFATLKRRVFIKRANEIQSTTNCWVPIYVLFNSYGQGSWRCLALFLF